MTGKKETENNKSSLDNAVQVVTLPQLFTLLISPKVKDQDVESISNGNKSGRTKYDKSKGRKITHDVSRNITNINGARTDFKRLNKKQPKFDKRIDRTGINKKIIPVFYVTNNSIALLGAMNKATNVIQVTSPYEYKSPLSVYVVKRVSTNLTTNWNKNGEKIEPLRDIGYKHNTERTLSSLPKYNPHHIDPVRIKENIFTRKTATMELNTERPIVNNEINFEAMLSNVLSLLKNNIPSDIQRNAPNPNINELNSSNITSANNSDELFSVYLIVKNKKIPLGIFNRSTLDKMLKKAPNSVLFSAYKIEDNLANRIITNVKDSEFFKSLDSFKGPWKNSTNIRNFANTGRSYLEILGGIDLTTPDQSTRTNSLLIKGMTKEYPIVLVLQKKPRITVVSPPNRIDNQPYGLNDKTSIKKKFNNGIFFKTTQRKGSNILGLSDNLGKQLYLLNEVDPINEVKTPNNGMPIHVDNENHMVVITNDKPSKKVNPDSVLSMYLVPNGIKAGIKTLEKQNIPKENAEVLFYYSNLDSSEQSFVDSEYHNRGVSVGTNIKKAIRKISAENGNSQDTVGAYYTKPTISDNRSMFGNSERFSLQNIERVKVRNNEKNQRKLVNLLSTLSYKYTTNLGKIGSGENIKNSTATGDLKSNTSRQHSSTESCINCEAISEIISPTSISSRQKDSKNNMIMTIPLFQLSKQMKFNNKETNGFSQSKSDLQILDSSKFEYNKKSEIKPIVADVIAALDKYCPSRTVKYPYMIHLLPRILTNSSPHSNFEHLSEINFVWNSIMQNDFVRDPQTAATPMIFFEESISRTPHTVQKRMTMGNFALSTPYGIKENDLYAKSPYHSYYESSLENILEPNHKTVEELMRESDEFGIVCGEHELVPVLKSLSQQRTSLLSPVRLTSSTPVINTPSTMNNHVCCYTSPHWSYPYQKIRNEYTFPSDRTSPTNSFTYWRPSESDANQNTFWPLASKINFDEQFEILSQLFKSISTTPQTGSMNPIPAVFQQKTISMENLRTASMMENLPCEHSIMFKMNPTTLKSFRSQDFSSTCGHYFQRQKTPAFDSCVSSSLSVSPTYRETDATEVTFDSTKKYDTTSCSCATASKDEEFISPVGIAKCLKHTMVIQDQNQPLKSEITGTLSSHDSISSESSSTVISALIYRVTTINLTKSSKAIKTAIQPQNVGIKKLSTLPCMCEHVEFELQKNLVNRTVSYPSKWLFSRTKNKDHKTHKKKKKIRGNHGKPLKNDKFS